ncbi:hypothetical protein HRbin11_00524 [bacterium HR11]|nr:hypothetical protein HRbin11_00524 [bacterium HR11]
MRERRKMAQVLAERYRRTRNRKEKGRILDEGVGLLGYHRKYAAWLLRHHGRRVRVGPRRYVVGVLGASVRRPRRRVYDGAVARALRELWGMMDMPCGKRMAAMLPVWMERLAACHAWPWDAEVTEKLRPISAATIDRLLAPERRRLALRRRTRTKPGGMLKHQIPIRTFADWDDAAPGFMEADLVAHDGGDSRGMCLCTLNLTDVSTGWTEMEALRNKAQVWTVEALDRIRQRLPFPLRGLDSDNGSEFINAHLLAYCTQHGITFTRSRPERKNDNCYVEQKNFMAIRRFVGYARYETEAELRILQELYGYLRLYLNFFQASVRWVEKVRQGSRLRRRYDAPQTPYQRLMADPRIEPAQKERLRQVFEGLHPAELHRHIRRLQDRLWRQVARRETPRRSGMKIPS